MPSDNLRPEDLFACVRCGDCCKGFGGTFVSREDIAAIAAFLRTEVAGFVERYCRISGGSHLLAQREDGFCVFWDGLCTIHPVKPRMCRRWPFIESVLIDPLNWRIMAGLCPGMRTDLPADRVRACVAQTLESEACGRLPSPGAPGPHAAPDPAAGGAEAAKDGL